MIVAREEWIVQVLSWIALFLSSWGALWLATDGKRFRTYWPGGLWSLGLAILGESLIRSQVDYFVERSLVLPYFRADFLNFFGPRFVEGVLFMQTLPHRRQLRRAFLWVAGIVGSEVALGLVGSVNLSWNGIGLALAVHSLRFLGLLGVYSAGGFSERKRRLEGGESLKRLLKASRTFWKFGWPIFGLGTALALKLTRGLDRWMARKESN